MKKHPKPKTNPKPTGFKKGGRPKATTPEDLNDPDFLHTILAEALRNARVDRNRAVKFLVKVTQQEVDEESDSALNFNANSVSKLFDSLSRINSQVVDVAQMIIKTREASAPKFIGAVPIQEVCGIDPDDLYDQFDEEDELEMPSVEQPQKEN